MKKGLKIIFYDENLMPQSTLTAKYGKYFENNQNMLIRDSVRIENNKLEVLETEELIWNSKLQKFYTEKFVKISSPIQVIFGDGMEANQNFTEYKITNVKGVIGVNKNAYSTNL
jgi:LPS export ABC transporter protein LptC